LPRKKSPDGRAGGIQGISRLSLRAVHVSEQRDRSRIPSPKRKLREGDIVSIDFGMEVDGYYADSAVTVPVGQIRPELRKLLDVTGNRWIARSTKCARATG